MQRRGRHLVKKGATSIFCTLGGGQMGSWRRTVVTSPLQQQQQQKHRFKEQFGALADLVFFERQLFQSGSGTQKERCLRDSPKF